MPDWPAEDEGAYKLFEGGEEGGGVCAGGGGEGGEVGDLVFGAGEGEGGGGEEVI